MRPGPRLSTCGPSGYPHPGSWLDKSFDQPGRANTGLPNMATSRDPVRIVAKKEEWRVCETTAQGTRSLNTCAGSSAISIQILWPCIQSMEIRDRQVVPKGKTSLSRLGRIRLHHAKRIDHNRIEQFDIVLGLREIIDRWHEHQMIECFIFQHEQVPRTFSSRYYL